MRFENLRDGIEDYEYLWLPRDALPKLDPSERKKAEVLLTIAAPLAESNAVYTENPSVIAERRAAIAAMLGKVGGAR